MTTIEILASAGGVGGVLAFLMFLSYRYLVNQLQQDKRLSEERLSDIIKEYNQTCREHTKATQDQSLANQEHAMAIRELYIYLKNKNGH